MVQRNRLEAEEADRRRRSARGESEAVASRRREIERNQERARQDLLDEVNADAAAAGT